MRLQGPVFVLYQRHRDKSVSAPTEVLESRSPHALSLSGIAPRFHLQNRLPASYLGIASVVIKGCLTPGLDRGPT